MLNLIEQTIKENKEIKVTKNIKARAKKWFLIKNVHEDPINALSEMIGMKLPMLIDPKFFI